MDQTCNLSDLDMDISRFTLLLRCSLLYFDALLSVKGCYNFNRPPNRLWVMVHLRCGFAIWFPMRMRRKSLWLCWNWNRQRLERYWRGIENLPKLFHHGGCFGNAQRKRGSEEEVRVRAVMALASAHEFEHRAWMPSWGEEKEPVVDGISKDWEIYDKPAPSPDHPVFGHAQLQLSIGYPSHHARITYRGEMLTKLCDI